jgi:hypothetical protein
MSNLVFSIISILATLSAALIGLKKGLRARSASEKNETKWLIGAAILFALASVYLSVDNFESSIDMVKKINVLTESNKFLTNYNIGTLDPPKIKVEVFKNDSQAFAVYHITNRSQKYPLKHLRIYFPGAGDDLNDKRTLKENLIGDIAPKDTEEVLVTSPHPALLEINFIIKWGSGNAIRCEEMGFADNNGISWVPEKKDVNIELPVHFGPIEKLTGYKFSVKCILLQNMITEKLLQQQAVIDSIDVRDEDVDALVSKRMKKMVNRAGGQQKLERYLKESTQADKLEIRRDIKKRIDEKKK